MCEPVNITGIMWRCDLCGANWFKCDVLAQPGRDRAARIEDALDHANQYASTEALAANIRAILGDSGE